MDAIIVRILILILAALAFFGFVAALFSAPEGLLSIMYVRIVNSYIRSRSLLECSMAKSTVSPTRTRQRRTLSKVARTFRLTPGKVTAAQRILGTKTATETIETALDMIVFRQRLVAGTAAMLGVDITPPDRDRP